jgi:PAS domain S-box-containing protein
MGKKLNRLLLIVFIGGLTWAALSDWAISYLARGLNNTQLEAVRAVNDVAWFGIVLVILYRQIERQQFSLAASEMQYRNLFAGNPNPMWIYDTETQRFVMVNQATIAKYGYSRSQFEKLTITDLRPETDQNRLVSMPHQFAHTLQQSGIRQHLKADGTAINVSIASHPLTFDGKPCKMVMVTDVTELIEKEARLSVSNKTLLQIAWSHSHELRKPLCSILAMLPILHDTQTDDERRELLGMLEICALELDESLMRNTEAITKVSDNIDLHDSF